MITLLSSEVKSWALSPSSFLINLLDGDIKEPTHLFENGPSQGLGDCYEPAVILDLYCCGDPTKLENLKKKKTTLHVTFAQHQTNFRLIENLCMESPSYL